MDSLFTLDGYNVKIKPEALFIPEINKIITRDKSKEKAKAIKELAYICFNNCPIKEINPYLSYSDKIKREKILEDVFGTKDWEADEEIIEAEKRYSEIFGTASSRLLDSATIAADKLSDYFTNIDFNEKNLKGDPAYKSTEVASNLSKVGKIVESLDQLKQQVEKELSEKLSARGGATLGPREMPKKNY